MLVLMRAVGRDRGHQCGEEVKAAAGGVGRRCRPCGAGVEEAGVSHSGIVGEVGIGCIE
jgi:hypothetical protein